VIVQADPRTAAPAASLTAREHHDFSSLPAWQRAGKNGLTYERDGNDGRFVGTSYAIRETYNVCGQSTEKTPWPLSCFNPIAPRTLLVPEVGPIDWARAPLCWSALAVRRFNLALFVIRYRRRLPDCSTRAASDQAATPRGHCGPLIGGRLSYEPTQEPTSRLPG